MIVTQHPHGVAPFVGAWIEIWHTSLKETAPAVAPFVGAWIEIDFSSVFTQNEIVAPFVGAWIEIFTTNLL